MNDSSHNHNHHNQDDEHLSHTLLQLEQLGLIHADAILANASAPRPNPAINNDFRDDTPWFIQLFFGLSGILASLFFIGFLSLLLFQTSVFDSTAGLLITGLLLSVASFALFKNESTRNNPFMSSLAFAIGVSGQAYVAFGLFNGDLIEPLDAWLLLLIQGIITLLMPNRIYRLLSSVATLSIVIYLLNYYHMPEASLGLLALITVISSLQRYELLRHLPASIRNGASEVISAVAYASAIMLLAVSVYFIAAEYGNGFGYNEGAFYYNYPLAQTLLILASLYAAYLILRRYQVKLLSTLGIISVVAILILGALSVYVSGLLATSLVIIIAMANSQKVLLALGIAALVGYIFWYYYQLDTSLLIKSLSMFVIGIAILLMRWLLVIFYPANSATPANINNIDPKERRL